uniref:RRM domain-containing protein n=1 Tax=Panagrolaimus sp. ES5 TaxID=591445 RepID=A0AC34FQE9_9BILA
MFLNLGGRPRGGTYNPDAGRGGGYTGHSEGFFNNDRSYDSGYSSRGGSERGSSYRGRGGSRGGSSGWNNDRQNGGGGYDDGYDSRESRDYYDRREHGASSRGGFSDTRGGRGRGSDNWRGGHERSSSYRGGESDRYEGHGEYDRNHYNDSDDKNSRDGAPGYGPNWNGAVVMVYGVNPAQFTCDRLFNLLCCYGNCLKIKYMHSKPDTCMVQMGSSEEATAVIEHLQECDVFGTKLSFRPSKQNIVHDVREPHNLADGSPAFRDYTSSTVHRFSSPQMAALNKIVFPNPELYWYNAPPIMSEEVMKKLFTQKHAPVPVQVTLLESSTSSSGLLRFSSTPESSEALMICNNMVIAGGVGSPPYVFKLSYASEEHKKAY